MGTKVFAFLSDNYFWGAHGTTTNGGVISVRGSTLRDSRSTYINNKARQGGAYNIEDHLSQVVISDCKFEANESFKEGGAVSLQGGNVRIVNTSFIKNKAEASGGAIMNFGETRFKFINCSFVENWAKLDGSVMKSLSNPSILDHVIEDSTFTSNSAGEFATLNLIFTTLVLSNCTFYNNYGLRKTEGVSVTQSEVELDNCYFKNE